MSRQPVKDLEPDRFCRNDGEETGIHVAEGYDLCLDCYRAYKAARDQPLTLPACDPSPEAGGGQHDLFGRAA